MLAGAAAEASEAVAMETAARPETKVDQGPASAPACASG